MNAAELAEQAFDKTETEAPNNGGQPNDKPAPPKDAGAGKPAAADDAGKDAGADKGKDDKPAKPEVKYDENGKRIEAPAEDDAATAAKDGKDDKATDTEGEFTADDAIEEEVPEPKEVTPTDSAGVALSAAEQKYIQDHIGEIGKPVRFTGTIGDKQVSYDIYDVSQLPGTFKPDNIVEFQQGVKTLDTMARKAEQLIGQYRQQQSQENAASFEKRENEAIRQDVADMQKEGEFPKFKTQPGTPGFDDDPAAQQMAEVLTVMNERNESYLKQYQQGRAYRHIGFREAFEIWQGKQATKTATKEHETAQKEEDDERKRTADRVGTNRGLTSKGIVKPTVRPGTTIDQILARHDQEF